MSVKHHPSHTLPFVHFIFGIWNFENCPKKFSWSYTINSEFGILKIVQRNSPGHTLKLVFRTWWPGWCWGCRRGMLHLNVHPEATPPAESFHTCFADLLEVITMEFHVLVQVLFFCKSFVTILALKFFIFPTVGSIMMIVLTLAFVHMIASRI